MSANKFDDYVIKGILSTNEFDIKQVLNLRTINTFWFSKAIYAEVEKSIKERNFKVLANGSIRDEKNSEYLTVMEFDNEIGNHFIVTVYDNDELWQDPQIIEIYPV